MIFFLDKINKKDKNSLKNFFMKVFELELLRDFSFRENTFSTLDINGDSEESPLGAEKLVIANQMINK